MIEILGGISSLAHSALLACRKALNAKEQDVVNAE